MDKTVTFTDAGSGKHLSAIYTEDLKKDIEEEISAILRKEIAIELQKANPEMESYLIGKWNAIQNDH